MLSRSRTTIPLNGMPLPPKHKRVAGGLLSGSGFTMAIRVALLGRDHILKMLAAIQSPSAKRSLLKTPRGLMRFAVPIMRKDDPTEDIAGIKLPKSKGHHTWTDEEISQYRAHWSLGTQQRLVFEFALETSSRRGEVVRLEPQHVKNGRIRIERTHGSEDVDIVMSPQLMASCDAMPKAHLTYIVTAYGKPRSKYGLGNDFAKWVTEAGLPRYCRLHGLKKAGMRRLAEAGGTAHELMAISGHKTLPEVQRCLGNELFLRLPTGERRASSEVAPKHHWLPRTQA
jgi:integrase/recombinase XerD